MSEGKDRSLIPFAIAGIVAFICFTAIVVMQVLEYMHYDQEPSLWNRPGYVQRAVPAPVQEKPDVAPDDAGARRSRRQEAAPEAETAEKPEAETGAEPDSPETADE